MCVFNSNFSCCLFDCRTYACTYRAREKIHDVNYWMRSFMKSVGTLIAEDGEEVLPTQMQPVGFEDFDSYLSSYVGDKAILSLLLDYDGTLAPIASHPDLVSRLNVVSNSALDTSDKGCQGNDQELENSCP